ncbi:MAG: ABC transporter permease [Candidatus Hodarchaeales archaeon]|jgi:ABC-2 type transport system permease protein
MTIKQILGISHRIGLQIFRSRWTIPYLIVFPIFFIGLYWFGFSASPIGENQTFLLGIINQDEGIPLEIQQIFQNDTLMGNWTFEEFHNAEVLSNGFGSEFVTILGNITYNNHLDSSQIFEIIELQNENHAELELKNRELDIVLILPRQFSNASLGLLNNYWKNTYGLYLHEDLQSSDPSLPDLPVTITENIKIKGDDSYLNYQIANSILVNIIEGYQDLTTAFRGPGGSIKFSMNEEIDVSIPTYSLFGLTIPGLIAFGIILQPSLISLFFCMEYRSHNRTFDLIRLSSSSPLTYVLGTFLIQIPVMIGQAFLLFTSSLVMGFQPRGDIVLAYLISLTILPFSASLTYATTAFFSNEDVVGTILGFGGPFLGFMSGAFIEVPKIVIAPNFLPTASGISRDFLIWDFLPLTHTVSALRQVLLYDFNITQVFPDILLSMLLSLSYFITSILIFIYFRFWRISQ